MKIGIAVPKIATISVVPSAPVIESLSSTFP